MISYSNFPIFEASLYISQLPLESESLLFEKIKKLHKTTTQMVN